MRERRLFRKLLGLASCVVEGGGIQRGDHLPEYVQEIEKQIVAIQQREISGVISSAEARDAVLKIQARVRKGLRSGDIVLQEADKVAMIPILGLTVTTSEAFEAAEEHEIGAMLAGQRAGDTAAILQGLRATHYFPSEGVLRWIGEGLDLVNPLADIADYAEIVDNVLSAFTLVPVEPEGSW